MGRCRFSGTSPGNCVKTAMKAHGASKSAELEKSRPGRRVATKKGPMGELIARNMHDMGESFVGELRDASRTSLSKFMGSDSSSASEELDEPGCVFSDSCEGSNAAFSSLPCMSSATSIVKFFFGLQFHFRRLCTHAYSEFDDGSSFGEKQS